MRPYIQNKKATEFFFCKGLLAVLLIRGREKQKFRIQKVNVFGSSLQPFACLEIISIGKYSNYSGCSCFFIHVRLKPTKMFLSVFAKISHGVMSRSFQLSLYAHLELINLAVFNPVQDNLHSQLNVTYTSVNLTEMEIKFSVRVAECHIHH